MFALSSSFRRRLRNALLLVGGAAFGAPACTETDTSIIEVSNEPTLGPGEICVPPAANQVRVRFEPNFLVLAPGQTRQARVVVDPDLCAPVPVSFESSDEGVFAPPADGVIELGSPAIAVDVSAGRLGTTTVAAVVPRGDGTTISAELAIDVIDDTLVPCSSTDDVPLTRLNAGGIISAAGTLAGAAIHLPDRADLPNGGSFLWSVAPFDTSVGCAGDLGAEGYLPMGPAVNFGPSDRSFPRDMPLRIPINPARLPTGARWRHLRVVHSSPRFKKPRPVTVSDPRVEKVDGVWTLSFRAPRLGSYQAVVRPDAGTRNFTRRITHRAVLGVSMGGIGAGAFGLRHHQLFDVVAAMGGPVDWTWMLDHIEKNHMGGFRPIAPGTQLADIPLEKTTCQQNSECASDETCLGVLDDAPGRCTLLPATDEPYVHASTFNNWWYEYPRIGHGGDFDRQEYVQIFRDLALTYGNPFSYNPAAPHLPAGIDPEHPAQKGDRANNECKVWVDPIDDHPDKDAQNALAGSCPQERCKHVQVLQNYYDDEYNPDGSFPVITFCDGAPQREELTPYANTWDDTNRYPMEVALAVDYNGNGVRDELEPIIRAGHERWDDWGEDGLRSEDEAGYGPDNLDPSGDDYEPQYNPTGTEGDHRWQPGEPFDDTGLDGVMGTSDSPYDFGEGDGEFTVTPGMQRFWDYDPHSMVRQWTDAMPQGPLDDQALHQVDFWTDGGTRDLFNFAEAARQLAGTFAARDRLSAFYTDFSALPGLDPQNPVEVAGRDIVWKDVPGVVMLRYGSNEPTEGEIESGNGQHVGSINEIALRLQWALYFIASRWPDAPRTRVETSGEKPIELPQPDGCTVAGSCDFQFTSSSGRTGPVGVTLPPGYFHADQQGTRYPVLYVGHGYGQTPEDLQIALPFLANWMNGAIDSSASRLPKAILVYTDGRCRPIDTTTGDVECVRGTFFTDSIRSDTAQLDEWWLELIDHIDRNFRTMGETEVQWTE